MACRQFVTVLAAAALLCCSALSEGSPRAAIEREYLKATEATKLRFLDGCVSMRHRDFKAYTPEGRPVSLALDRQRLLQIFATAVSVQEKMQVLAFRQDGKGQIVCEVHDTFEYVVVGEFLKQGTLVTFDTRSTDTWVKTPQGWKLLVSKVARQSATQKPLHLEEGKGLTP